MAKKQALKVEYNRRYTVQSQLDVRQSYVDGLMTTINDMSLVDLHDNVAQYNDFTPFELSYGNRKIKDIINYLPYDYDDRDQFNRKVTRTRYFATLNLPSGFTCALANDCLVYAHKITGRQSKQRYTRYACYASNLETAFPNTRRLVWRNMSHLNVVHKSSLDTMSKAYAYASMIARSANWQKTGILRLQSHGDFATIEYFLGAYIFALLHPTVDVFWYTKHLDYTRTNVRLGKAVNFQGVYSIGGLDDQLVKAYDKIAYVITDDSAQVTVEINDHTRIIDLTCKHHLDGADFTEIMSQSGDIGLALH